MLLKQLQLTLNNARVTGPLPSQKSTCNWRPSGSPAENLPAGAGDKGSVPGSERSPGEHCNSSVLAWEIPQTGAWQATVRGVAVRHNLATTNPQAQATTDCARACAAQITDVQGQLYYSHISLCDSSPMPCRKAEPALCLQEEMGLQEPVCPWWVPEPQLPW